LSTRPIKGVIQRMGSFQETLQSERFLVTAVVVPPKGVNVETFNRNLAVLSGKVDAVNIPDNRFGRVHMGSLGAAVLAKAKGLEPIFTLCCRDRNRMALNSDLLSAFALGLTNVLCVSGDYFTFGDAIDTKPVYDLDSVQAIQMIRRLEQGTDIGGNDLDGKPRFCVGCAANPQAVPFEPHRIKLEKKMKAGAQFIQTLDLFDLEKTQPFFEFVRQTEVKVLAGLRLVTEKEVALWEAGRLPGNEIPEETREEIKGISDPERILERARGRMVEMIRQVKDSGLCHGVHLTVEGHEELIPEIIREAGI
jgi:methylenetetrahydrofolate reductase (NADPH)